MGKGVGGGEKGKGEEGRKMEEEGGEKGEGDGKG